MITAVGDLVRLGAMRSPQHPAVRMRGGRALTYAELDLRTDRLANALLGLGLRHGDRVAAWMEDSVEYVELYLAVAKAGLVMVPINARLLAGEAAHPLRDSGARLLFWSGGLADRVEQLGADMPLVAVGAGAGPASEEYEALLARGAAVPPPSPAADDAYVIGYTSGTTGRPKGAVLTHRSVLAIARLNAVSYHLPLQSVAALTGSMSFVATVPAHIICHLYLGGSMIVMGRWDVESLIATVAAERATFAYVPSPLLDEFCDLAAADPQPWSSLRCVLHSASRAAPEKLSRLVEVVGERFVEGLGMTENSGGLITATTPADVRDGSGARDFFASVGRPVAESAVRIVDSEGRALAPGDEEVGELAIRSPALMSGYWNMPDATSTALRDGWYLTGDLASIDAAGFVYVSDRRTDLIVSGGINVYPLEVEELIAKIPGVREVAVVGTHHERWGQAVTAVVVREPGANVSSAQVIDRCRAELAGFKKPSAVHFVEALPRTSSLKVKRGEVRAQLEGDPPPPTRPRTEIRSNLPSGRLEG